LQELFKKLFGVLESPRAAWCFPAAGSESGLGRALLNWLWNVSGAEAGSVYFGRVDLLVTPS